MKFLAYILSVVAANLTAVLASTFILRFKPLTWLVSAYGWSEFAINAFAFLVGAVTGLQVSRLICHKVASSEIGPFATWIVVLPFILLGLGEVAKNGNWMGVIGSIGAIVGVLVFKGMLKEESEGQAAKALFAESNGQ